MDLTAFFEWLSSTALALEIQQSMIWFPLLESLHVMGVALVFGTIFFVDARLVGFGSRGQAVTSVMKAGLRWTWIGFVLAALTGALMFVSNAPSYADNVPFQFKMLLLVFAGINMLVFEFVIVRDLPNWDTLAHTPTAARVSGGLSILFWLTIITLGRWIGFTESPF